MPAGKHSESGSAIVEFIVFTLAQCLILSGTLQVAATLDRQVVRQLEVMAGRGSPKYCGTNMTCLDLEGSKAIFAR